MAAKILLLLALAVVGSQSQAVTEVQLQDVTTTHISSPWHAKSIGIGILFLDKLVSCHILFPNGVIYELYPSAHSLPHTSMISNAQGGNAMFPSCGMFFQNAPVSLSGTYEVLCLVEHFADSSRTLTRQKNHITFQMSEVVFPTKDLEQAKEEIKA